MKIQPILNFNVFSNKQNFNNDPPHTNILKSSNDIISFSARRINTSIDERMSEYAVKLLKEQNT